VRTRRSPSVSRGRRVDQSIRTSLSQLEDDSESRREAGFCEYLDLGAQKQELLPLIRHDLAHLGLDVAQLVQHELHVETNPCSRIWAIPRGLAERVLAGLHFSHVSCPTRVQRELMNAMGLWDWAFCDRWAPTRSRSDRGVREFKQRHAIQTSARFTN